MSVSAVVYKRLEDVSFPPNADLSHVVVDDTTGEVYFDAAFPEHLPRGAGIESQKRLGNMARIDSLREEIGGAFSKRHDSLLLSAVLYDGTHGGDIIEIEKRARLKGEVEFLRKTFPASDEL